MFNLKLFSKTFFKAKLYNSSFKNFSPRLINSGNNIITKLDNVEIENLKELLNNLKEVKEEKPLETKEQQTFDEYKNLIIINTENVENEIDKKITVNEIDWQKSNLKEYKIVFNESTAEDNDKDLGYITFDEDGKSRTIPTYKDYQEELKSRTKSSVEDMGSSIIFDDSKKPEVTVATTKSYFVFPEQRDYALRYYEILTTKGRITQKDLVELEKIKPKYLVKYNSKPYGKPYIYKNFSDALEEMRVYLEMKPELGSADVSLKIIINIDTERVDHNIKANLGSDSVTLKRENIVSLGTMTQTDQEIKKSIKQILDNIYSVKPQSVVGRYFLSASLLLDNKEFHVDIAKPAKSRNKTK
jgi:hypothetical protein